jgi:hypothetical protein
MLQELPQRAHGFSGATRSIGDERSSERGVFRRRGRLSDRHQRFLEEPGPEELLVRRLGRDDDHTGRRGHRGRCRVGRVRRRLRRDHQRLDALGAGRGQTDRTLSKRQEP